MKIPKHRGAGALFWHRSRQRWWKARAIGCKMNNAFPCWWLLKARSWHHLKNFNPLLPAARAASGCSRRSLRYCSRNIALIADCRSSFLTLFKLKSPKISLREKPSFPNRSAIKPMSTTMSASLCQPFWLPGTQRSTANYQLLRNLLHVLAQISALSAEEAEPFIYLWCTLNLR